ncbi:MAG: tetratricopeptide repeat protein [Pseudomonadota bacterium]
MTTRPAQHPAPPSADAKSGLILLRDARLLVDSQPGRQHGTPPETPSRAAASQLLQRALPLLKNDPLALLECSQLCERIQDWPTAEKIFSRLHELEPAADHEACMAAALYNQRRFQEALNHFDQYSKRKPEAIPAWLNISACLLSLGRLEEAAGRLRHWVALKPDDQRVHQALGFILMHLREQHEADKVISRMLEIFPINLPLRSLAGKHYLRSGDYRRGFDYYRSRWAPNPALQPTVGIPCDTWDGQRFDGTLLIAAEKALGEEILASSMFGDLGAMQQHALIECDSRLLPIFRRSFPALEFVPRGQGLLAAACVAGGDCHDGTSRKFRKIDAGDLGFHFRRHGEFPPRLGWLIADPEKVARLRARYQQVFGHKMRIGIGWKSTRSVEHVNLSKSIGLRAFAQVLAHPDIVGISLQHGDVGSDIARLKAEMKLDVHVDSDIDPNTDIDALLAQIAAMDLVISCSNSAVHLAGALGIPCWLVLRRKQFLVWYWGYTGGLCHWYPSIEIIRADDTLSDQEGIDKVFAGLRGRLDIAREPIADTHKNLHNHSLAEQRLLDTVRELLASRQPEQAAQILRTTPRLLGNNPDALLESARLCQNLHDWETTEAIFRRLGELRPDSGFEAGLAAALFHQRHFADALPWYTRYSQIQPHDDAGWMGAALCLNKLGRKEEAIKSLRRGNGMLPREPLFELLTLLSIQTGDRDAAEDAVTDALHHFPDSATLHTIAGKHYLRCGDYRRGFDAHRNRWFGNPEPQPTLGIPCAAWDGCRFEGTLLIAAEEALGEEILASSMFGDLVAMQQQALIECTPRLLPVFRRSFPALDFVPRSQGLLAAACAAGNSPHPAFRKIDAGDLGYHLRRHGEFPSRQGWLVADPEKVARLRARYRQQFGDQPRIGIGWKSTRRLEADFEKNIDPSLLAPLLARPDSIGISLQHGDIAGDVARLKAMAGVDLYVDPEVDTNHDLDALVAQIACLDRVVSTSNSAVHLAGALGIPCALLLQKKQPLMWYWGYEGANCPWYPAVKIFRVSQFMNINEAIAAAAADLPTTQQNSVAP